MSTLYDCDDPDERTRGVRHAVDALRRGELVVMPTDTVYGVAADAFDAVAVAGLLAAKGRGRSMPPPVLVHDARALDGLVDRHGEGASGSITALVDAFWPGGLTLVCWAQPSLRWDLGDTAGTVGVRVPDDDLAREVLAATGPLAVSSANATGRPPGTTAAGAREQLGDGVSCYLEEGPREGGLPSTVLDLTGPRPLVLRLGAVGMDELRRVVPDVRAPETPAEPGATSGERPAGPPEPGQGGLDDDAADGDAADGEGTDGNETDGDVTDGEATAEDATEGDATEGEATDGEATAEDATDGDVTDGDGAPGAAGRAPGES